MLRTAVAIIALAVVPLAGGATEGFPGVNGRIAFSASLTGEYDIFTMNPDGSDRRQLTSNTGSDNYGPHWSPDGKRIAFTTSCTQGGAGCTSDVLVMNADGSNKVDLGPGWNPDWSPNGTQIVYGGGPDLSSLWVMDSDGSNAHVLLVHPPDVFFSRPVWSPDGGTIAFEAKSGAAPGVPDLWLAESDGTNVRQALSSAEYPEWSPDGKRLAVAHGPGSSTPLWLVNADGTGTRQSGSVGAAWSPDGRLLYIGGGIMLANGPAALDAAGFEGYVAPVSGFGITYSWQPLSAGSPPAPAPPFTSTGRLCTIRGTRGADTLKGNGYGNVICGLGGNDTLDGKSGSDVVDGGAGNDTIQARDGKADVVIGGPGNDKAKVDQGLDVVTGVEKLLP